MAVYALAIFDLWKRYLSFSNKAEKWETCYLNYVTRCGIHDNYDDVLNYIHSVDEDRIVHDHYVSIIDLTNNTTLSNVEAVKSGMICCTTVLSRDKEKSQKRTFLVFTLIQEEQSEKI